MRTKKKIFWGIILVLAAVFLLVSQMGLIPELNIGFWTIVWTIVSAAILINGIAKFQFSGIFFGLAFLGIIYDEPLGISAITPWPILGAALLLSIGCNMLFPKRKHKKIVNVTCSDHWDNEIEVDREKGEDREEHFEGADGEYLEFKQVFKSGTKYVTSANLKSIEIECVFSNMEIYLDNATLAGGVATLSVESVFSHMNIYVPRSWIVEENSENVFASVNVKGKPSPDGCNKLYLKGENVFGGVDVIYI